jgi:hypothetical protein
MTTSFNASGTYAAANVTNGIAITDSASNNYEGQLATYPTPPFTRTALLSIPWGAGTDSRTGLVIASSPSGNREIFTYLNYGNLSVIGCTTYSCGSFSSLYTLSIASIPQFLWMRITDDGTYVTYSISTDGSVFIPEFKETKSTGYLGASGYNYIGVIIAAPGGNTGTTLMSWQ